MDLIVATALVGTARQAQPNPPTDTPVDTLMTALPEGEAERKLLLSAGALAVYRQAGYRSTQIAAVPEIAAPEKLRACTLEIALLLSRLLGGEQSALLPEALTRLREAGMHLPYNLLPQALDTNLNALRAVLFPVLGERGLWLSQFNSNWKWVRNYLATDQSGLPGEAETIWQEGTNPQRIEILRRLRAVDTQKGREWLEAVWKQEKADVRTEMLQALEVGLSLEDEALLEKAQDDRATGVRAAAVALLSRLPDTAFGARMRALGSSMLSMQNGVLTIKPLTTYDKAWLRDGIDESLSATKLGKRAWWMIQILSLVPPTFWETHLGATPEELITLAKTAEKWGTNVIEAWSRAAITYNASNWLLPLWNWWRERNQTDDKEPITDYSLPEKLFASFSQADAEKTISLLFNQTWEETGNSWNELISALPTPWSEETGLEFLRLLRAHCQIPQLLIQQYNPYGDAWFNNLSTIALALPVACFTEAQTPWEVPPRQNENDWQATHIKSLLKEFVEIIQMRQKIYEEII